MWKVFFGLFTICFFQRYLCVIDDVCSVFTVGVSFMVRCMHCVLYDLFFLCSNLLLFVWFCSSVLVLCMGYCCRMKRCSTLARGSLFF